MSAVGIRADYVDTQDISLQVSVENFIFTQVTNVKINRERDVTTHYLTDDTVERVSNLEIPSIEGDVVLTVPEITFWNLLLETDSQGLLTVRDWTLKFTSQSGASDSYTLQSAKVTQFYATDPGLGIATHHFIIEGVSVA